MPANPTTCHSSCYAFSFNLRHLRRPIHDLRHSTRMYETGKTTFARAHHRHRSITWHLSSRLSRDPRVEFRATTGALDWPLPMMIFETMPTAAKVMLLAMFHSRDVFRSRGMIHSMLYGIASTATTVRDYLERTAVRRLSEATGNGFPARDRPVFRNARQPSSCASQRHVSRRGHVAERPRASPSVVNLGRSWPSLIAT